MAGLRKGNEARARLKARKAKKMGIAIKSADAASAQVRAQAKRKTFQARAQGVRDYAKTITSPTASKGYSTFDIGSNTSMPTYYSNTKKKR